MTENMKQFLEAISQDKEFIEKLTRAETPEAVIGLAAEKGFALTAEDLKPEPVSGEVSDGELDAAAGGKACSCFLGGGGEAESSNVCYWAGDTVCWCVGAGAGDYTMRSSGGVKENPRCICAAAGHGISGDYL